MVHGICVHDSAEGDICFACIPPTEGQTAVVDSQHRRQIEVRESRRLKKPKKPQAADTVNKTPEKGVSDHRDKGTRSSPRLIEKEGKRKADEVLMSGKPKLAKKGNPTIQDHKDVSFDPTEMTEKAKTYCEENCIEYCKVDRKKSSYWWKFAHLPKNGKGEKSYICNFCGCKLTYSSSSSVLRHIQSNHRLIYEQLEILKKEEDKPNEVSPSGNDGKPVKRDTQTKMIAHFRKAPSKSDQRLQARKDLKDASAMLAARACLPFSMFDHPAMRFYNEKVAAASKAGEAIHVSSKRTKSTVRSSMSSIPDLLSCPNHSHCARRLRSWLRMDATN